MLSQYKVGFDISGLDPSFKGHAGRGIGRYVAELHNYFINKITLNNLDQTRVGFFDYKSFALPNFLDKGLKAMPVGRQTIRQQLFYPLQLSTGIMKQFDLLHFPAQTDAPSWCPKKFIISVHDLIPLVCKDLYGAESNSWRFQLARKLELLSIKKATRILASSESTSKDLQRILKVPVEKIDVIPLGINSKFFQEPDSFDIDSERSKYRLLQANESLLYVGGIDPRKNIDGLLGIFSGVKKERRNRGISVKLIIAGNISKDKNYPKLLDKIKQLSIFDDVVITGFISDSDLLKLYRVCSVFLFPSLYEGFGFPVGEAMAGGIPVVAGNTSSIPELTGDSCLLFDPNNVDSGVKAVLAILENQSMAKELAQNGRKRIARFTWENTADLTLKAYDKCRL